MTRGRGHPQGGPGRLATGAVRRQPAVGPPVTPCAGPGCDGSPLRRPSARVFLSPSATHGIESSPCGVPGRRVRVLANLGLGRPPTPSHCHRSQLLRVSAPRVLHPGASSQGSVRGRNCEENSMSKVADSSGGMFQRGIARDRPQSPNSRILPVFQTTWAMRDGQAAPWPPPSPPRRRAGGAWRETPVTER